MFFEVLFVQVTFSKKREKEAVLLRLSRGFSACLERGVGMINYSCFPLLKKQQETTHCL